MKLDLFGIVLWLIMACWEVYDLHPDHLIAYSILWLGPIVLSMGRHER